MTDPAQLLDAYLGLFALLIAVIGVLMAEFHTAKAGNLGTNFLNAYRYTSYSLVGVLFVIAASSTTLLAFGSTAEGGTELILLSIVFYLTGLMAYVVWRFMN